jgi:hypothetical protein
MGDLATSVQRDFGEAASATGHERRKPQARMRLRAWGPETAAGSGDYVAASAVTEAHAVPGLHRDRGLTLQGLEQP